VPVSWRVPVSDARWMCSSSRWYRTAVSKSGAAGWPSLIARANSRYSSATFLGGPAGTTRFGELWEALSSVTVPLLLARGMRPDSVLDDDDERELLRRLPAAQVVHVAEAGHSLQGDTPLELAAIIEEFVFGS
jgi:pimeloyl-ACP methyl ester carboxylesterase